MGIGVQYKLLLVRNFLIETLTFLMKFRVLNEAPVFIIKQQLFLNNFGVKPTVFLFKTTGFLCGFFAIEVIVFLIVFV